MSTLNNSSNKTFKQKFIEFLVSINASVIICVMLGIGTFTSSKNYDLATLIVYIVNFIFVFMQFCGATYYYKNKSKFPNIKEETVPKEWYIFTTLLLIVTFGLVAVSLYNFTW